MSGSSPAVLARKAAEVVSRRVTSSERTSSRNSAWPISRARARARRSGRVSRQRPSLTARSTVLSSLLITGAGAVMPTPPPSGCSVAKSARRAGEPRPGEQAGAGARPAAGAVLGASFEHPADQRDVERLGLRRPGAGRLDPLRSPLLDQPEQGVDLAHLGPGQRVVEQRGGVGADRRAVPGGQALEGVEVAQGVDRLLGREVGGVGDPPTGAGAGMDLDQLAPVEDPHQLPVGAHRRPGRRSGCRGSSTTPWPPRCGGPGAPWPWRRSAGRRRVGRGRQQPGCLLQGEQLSRPALRSCRGCAARPGPDTTPRRGAGRRPGR